MAATNIFLESDDERNLNELRLKIQNEKNDFSNISKKDIISKALEFTNEYYGVHEYGNLKDIDKQIMS